MGKEGTGSFVWSEGHTSVAWGSEFIFSSFAMNTVGSVRLLQPTAKRTKATVTSLGFNVAALELFQVQSLGERLQKPTGIFHANTTVL